MWAMGTRWLAVTWAGGGNVGPLTCLSAGLMERGHVVAAVATPSICDRLIGHGLSPVQESEGWLPDADELLAAVDRLRPDGLIVDYMLTDALCGAAATGLPTVVLVHTLFRALLVDRAPAPMAMSRQVTELNERRSRLGLPDVASLGDLLEEANLVLVSAPEALDSPGPAIPNLIYTGPLIDPPRSPAGWSPPPGSDPLVVVSLGTAMSGGIDRETELLQRIMDALSHLPVRAVVNLPEYIDASSLVAPANVSITGYVPHGHLLADADLLVTHSGLGSVCAALTAGVPMVCLPLDRDQPANAEAVTRIGAGLQLAPDCALDQLASAIEEGLGWHPRMQIEADPARALDAIAGVLRDT